MILLWLVTITLIGVVVGLIIYIRKIIKLLNSIKLSNKILEELIVRKK